VIIPTLQQNSALKKHSMRMATDGVTDPSNGGHNYDLRKLVGAPFYGSFTLHSHLEYRNVSGISLVTYYRLLVAISCSVTISQ
jgi:hypothetical protein